MPKRYQEPNFENCAQEELVTAMNATPKKRYFIRLFAIQQLSAKIPRESLAKGLSVTVRTVDNWVRRFNESGIDGLIDRPGRGRPGKITKEQSGRYKELIENPDLAGHKHWTAKKFHGYISNELKHELGYTTVIKWLKENNYRLKVPRPWSQGQDEEARKAFVEKLKDYLSDENIDIWYGDEMGVEGDPRPRRRWAQKGEKITVGYNGGHIRMNVTGMVSPRTGQFYALEFSHSDSLTFQFFLKNANSDISFERPRNLLILDNASWHKKKSIDWGRFEPIYLPPYSPDLNPIERLWLLIKAEWFTDFVAQDRQQLIKRLDKALIWAMDRSSLNSKTCAF